MTAIADLREPMVNFAPAIFVDVDGVLNAFWNTEQDSVTFDAQPFGPAGPRYQVSLVREHGKMLKKLRLDTGSELIWCTFWEEHANNWIAPRLGLDKLPWVPIDAADWRCEENAERTPGERKANKAYDWLLKTGRSAVWFDDEPDILSTMQARFNASDDRMPPCVHIVQVPPNLGLQQAHIEEAREWLMGPRVSDIAW